MRPVTGRVIPASEHRPFDLNPASVEESAAAEQQHDKDNDEQGVRVHLFSSVFGWSDPAGNLALRRQDRAPTTLPAGQGLVCCLLHIGPDELGLVKLRN